MQATFLVCALLGSLAHSVTASPGFPNCKPALEKKLSRCATGQAFCTSLLGYSAGQTSTLTIETNTHTTTTVTSTQYVGSSTATVTSTYYGVTSTNTTTSTITIPTLTLTLPSGLQSSPSCYVAQITDSAPGVPAVKVAPLANSASCGLNNPASVLQTACHCFIDVHATAIATITKTITSHVTTAPTTTLTAYETTTLFLSTTTVVGSTTSTVNLPACQTPATTCGNAGLQWAYYNASSTAANSPANPANNAAFDPSTYKSVIPFANGTASLISIPETAGTGTQILYGQGPFGEVEYVMDHKGYLFVPQTGNYTFYFNYVDDEAFFYHGAPAYSGWDLTNYDFTAVWYTNPLPHFTLSLTAGTYLPIRLPFGQGAENGGLDFDIVAPDGQYVTTSNAGSALIASPYFVQRSCDGTAPAFAPWGSET